MYELRLYKNIKAANNPNPIEHKDYITLLKVDWCRPHKDIHFTWLTPDKMFDDVDFDFVTDYRDSVAEEVKTINSIDDFKNYIRFFVNEIRWVDTFPRKEV